MEGQEIYKVVWPRSAGSGAGGGFLARRAATLQGAVVAELWDYVFRGNEIFQALERELSARYPGIKFVHYDVFGNIHGGDEGRVLESLREKFDRNHCTAVIVGVGC